MGIRTKAMALMMVGVMTLGSTGLPSSAVTQTMEKGGLLTKEASSHWAASSLTWAVNEKIMQGDGLGNLNPNRQLTEQELMTLMSKAFGEELQAWGTYASTAISRADFAIILCNKLKLNPIDANHNTAEDLTEEGEQALKVLLQSGLISGYKDGSLGADRTLTRAEAAVVLKKAIGQRLSAPQTVAGLTYKESVTVTSADVKLDNVIIEKDLFLSQGIGEKEVYLNRVTVKGRVIVEGGGSNSVYISNSNLNEMILNKKNGDLRVVIENGTQVSKLILNETASLKVDENAKISELKVPESLSELQLNEKKYELGLSQTSLPLGLSTLSVKRFEKASSSVLNELERKKEIAVSKAASGDWQSTTKTTNPGEGLKTDATTSASKKETSKNPSSSGGSTGTGGGSSANSGGGSSSSNGSSPSQQGGSNNPSGSGSNGTKPSEPGLRSEYITLKQLKWIDVEGTRYLVLGFSKGIYSDYKITVDSQVVSPTPVNMEGTLSKIELLTKPAQMTIAPVRGGTAEQLNLQAIFNPEKPSETAKKMSKNDLIWANTLVEHPNNDGQLLGQIQLKMPEAVSGKIATDVVSGATPRGNTSMVYVENIPEGLKTVVKVDQGNPGILNLSFEGKALAHGKQNQASIVVKILSKAFEKVNPDFIQADQPFVIHFN